MEKEIISKENGLPSWVVNLRSMVKTAGSPQVFAKRLHDSAVKLHRPTLSVKELTNLILTAQHGDVGSMNILMKDYRVYSFITSWKVIDTESIVNRPKWMGRGMWKKIVNSVFPRIQEPQEQMTA